MKIHVNAVITKFLFVGPVLGFIAMIFSNMDLKIALVMAMMISLGTYFSADLVLLPRMGNIAALAGDGVITAVVYWEMTFLKGYGKFSIIGLLLSTALIVFGEMYFHNYLKKTVFKRKQASNQYTQPKTIVNQANKYKPNKNSKKGK